MRDYAPADLYLEKFSIENMEQEVLPFCCPDICNCVEGNSTNEAYF